MSEFIYASIQRAGNTQPYVQNVFIQMSKMSAKEAAEFSGSDPNFSYHMYTKSLPVQDSSLVQQFDLVTDTNPAIPDPKTHAPRQFRIISDPSPKALMMSWSWIAIHMRGS